MSPGPRPPVGPRVVRWDPAGPTPGGGYCNRPLVPQAKAVSPVAGVAIGPVGGGGCRQVDVEVAYSLMKHTLMMTGGGPEKRARGAAVGATPQGGDIFQGGIKSSKRS